MPVTIPVHTFVGAPASTASSTSLVVALLVVSCVFVVAIVVGFYIFFRYRRKRNEIEYVKVIAKTPFTPAERFISGIAHNVVRPPLVRLCRDAALVEIEEAVTSLPVDDIGFYSKEALRYARHMLEAPN